MSITTAEGLSKRTPPYVAFASFKSFLANLREGGLPIVIGNSVYGNMSGSLRSQLKGALRFFDLVDETNRPSRPTMDALVEATADAEAWKACVGQLLADYYAPILAHPLTSTTPGQLQKEFQANYTGSSDVIEKAITFFIFAAKDAGIPLSPRLTERQKPQRRAGNGRRRPESSSSSSDANQKDESAVSDAPLAEIRDVTAEAMTRILRSKPPKKVRDAVMTVILYLTMGEEAFDED